MAWEPTAHSPPAAMVFVYARGPVYLYPDMQFPQVVHSCPFYLRVPLRLDSWETFGQRFLVDSWPLHACRGPGLRGTGAVGLRVTSTGAVVSTPGEDEITQEIYCRGKSKGPKKELGVCCH